MLEVCCACGITGDATGATACVGKPSDVCIQWWQLKAQKKGQSVQRVGLGTTVVRSVLSDS